MQEINTRFGKSYILLDEDGRKYWSDKNTKKMLDNSKNIDNIKFSIYLDSYAWFNGHKYVKNIIKILDTGEPDYIEKIEPDPKKQVDKYRRLEDLNPGDIITVEKYGLKLYKNKERYILYTDAGEFIDNTHLNDLYKKLTYITRHKIIAVKIKKTKTTRKKEMDVRLIFDNEEGN